MCFWPRLSLLVFSSLPGRRQMTRAKPTLKSLAAFAALTAVGIGGITFAEQQRQQVEAEALKMNQSRTHSCIALKGQSYGCNFIDLSLLDSGMAEKVTPFIEKWKKAKADSEANLEAANKKFRAQQQALADQRKREAAETEAKVKFKTD